MPANAVKPGQEGYWRTAKAYCKRKGYTGDRLYKCTMGTFKKIVANAKKGKGRGGGSQAAAFAAVLRDGLKGR